MTGCPEGDLIGVSGTWSHNADEVVGHRRMGDLEFISGHVAGHTAFASNDAGRGLIRGYLMAGVGLMAAVGVAPEAFRIVTRRIRHYRVVRIVASDAGNAGVAR